MLNRGHIFRHFCRPIANKEIDFGNLQQKGVQFEFIAIIGYGIYDKVLTPPRFKKMY